MGIVAMDREELAKTVIEDMVADGLSLRKAAAKHGTTCQTVLRAVGDSPALAEHYDRARAAVIERLADEVMDLADDPIPKLDNGATDPGAVRQRQLQVDTRKWFLSKLAPKVYGDKLDISVQDTRISIQGALQAAQTRMLDVLDVTPRLALSDAQDALPSASRGEGEGRG